MDKDADVYLLLNDNNSILIEDENVLDQWIDDIVIPVAKKMDYTVYKEKFAKGAIISHKLKSMITLEETTNLISEWDADYTLPEDVGAVHDYIVNGH